ncbi:MAG: copper resistance protein CopC [Caldilineaceae bacterium]
MKSKLTFIRRWAPLFALLLGLFAPFATASAHADLVRSDPPENSVLGRPPREVRLWFSEALSPQSTTVQLLNAQGEPIKVTLQAAAEPADQLVVALPNLPPGAYNLSWKTFSADDGHLSPGHLVFGIGAGADLASFADAATLVPVPWGEALLRWLTYATEIGLLGALAVILLIFDPALRVARATVDEGQTLAKARGRVWVWAAFLALAALCVGGAMLVWQARAWVLATEESDVAGVPIFIQALGQVLNQTRWSTWWLVHQTILLALLVATYPLAKAALSAEPGRPQSSEKKAMSKAQPRTAGERVEQAEKLTKPLLTLSWPQIFLLSGLALALVTSQAFLSHAAALTTNPALAIGAVALHLLAASVWVGGLLALSIGLFPQFHHSSAGLASLGYLGWRPFSRLAVVSVGLVVATGLYSTGRQVASVDALLTTRYGWLLLSKSGLVVGSGLIGLLNSVLLHPKLAAPLARGLGRPVGWTPLAQTRLPGLVLAEAGLGLAVLLVTGLLTSSAPAHGAQFVPVATQAALTQSVDDLTITVNAQPNQPGANQVNIQVAGGTDQAEIIRVITRFTYLGQAIGTVSADAAPAGGGRYAVNGLQLSITGPWQITVVVRRKGVEDSTATFNWTVGVPTRPVVLSNRPLAPVLTIAAIVLLLLCGLGLLLGLRRKVSAHWLRRQSARTHGQVRPSHG